MRLLFAGNIGTKNFGPSWSIPRWSGMQEHGSAGIEMPDLGAVYAMPMGALMGFKQIINGGTCRAFTLPRPCHPGLPIPAAFPVRRKRQQAYDLFRTYIVPPSLM